MIKRIVEVSHPSYLYMKNSQLYISQEKQVVAKIPIEDIGVILLTDRAITITQAVMSAALENNTVIVLCNNKYQPISIVLPMVGHSLHARIMQEQISFSMPRKKAAWKNIIQAKILAQANNLDTIHKQHLIQLAKQVKSGDPENKEAQAAQYYWKKLLGNDFLRNPELEGQNALLNYGYAILRSAVARSIVCGGLHPALGIHHCNLYNSFALADDLMEPLRPKVDFLVKQLPEYAELNAQTRTMFLELLSTPVKIKHQNIPLMVALHHYVSSFKRFMLGESKTISIPTWDK